MGVFEVPLFCRQWCVCNGPFLHSVPSLAVLPPAIKETGYSYSERATACPTRCLYHSVPDFPFIACSSLMEIQFTIYACFLLYHPLPSILSAELFPHSFSTLNSMTAFVEPTEHDIELCT